jgi:tetratricopeptide (TPR) repeat protein/predicted Ser/Thr protein kinase
MSTSEQEEKTPSPSSSLEEAPTFVRPPSGSEGERDTVLSSASREKEDFTVPGPGHTVAGRYMVFEQVGQGGMGVVLAAYDSRLDRRVALKLLRSQEPTAQGSSDGEVRLVREAQAMARLNHPSVVAVYDAGTLAEGSLFIAMEYVEGQTLRRWREEQPRSWREVLQAYLAAGRGLAAAHAAGLIHRDFKPDNVLVGKDGRVRVTDFGLARADSAPLPSVQLPASLSSDSLSSALTIPGTLMGTPRYMAPELMRGEPAGVRSDLYAFCVSLYEALYGQLPFAGESMAEYSRARSEGRITPPPAQSAVPAWLARIVLQGLQVDPHQRPDSMEALLALLEDDPEVRRQARRSLLALASLGVVLAGLAAWGWVRQQAQEPVCGRVASRLDGIWDAAVKARVRESLLGTGLPYAPDTVERVFVALDGYAQGWVSQGTELCEAEQAAQLPRLAALREACLERRRSRLRATTELLAGRADPKLLEKAVQAIEALPPLEDCRDDKALTAAVLLPEEPALRVKVEALLGKMDRVEALQEAGKYKEGLAAAEALLPEVEPVGHAPLHAQLLQLTARLKERTGDFKGAEELGRQALALAARGQDLPLMSRALSHLVVMVGVRQGRFQEVTPLEPLVEAVAESTGNELLLATALTSLGRVLLEQGKYPQAKEKHLRALALRQKALGPEHTAVASSLGDLGMVAGWMGEHEEALAKNEQAMALMQKALGPEHPDLIRFHVAMGAALRDLGRYEETRQQFERVCSLSEKVLGPEHPVVSTALNNLGIALNDLGRHEEALEKSERALAMREKLHGRDHQDVPGPLINAALALSGMGRHKEALETTERALAIWERSLGPTHPLLAGPLTLRGVELRHLGRYAEARAPLERALAIQEKELGREHPDLTHPLVAQGELLLSQRRPAEALPILERALKLSPPGNVRAEAQFALARALWEARSAERPRARALATQARDYWQRLGQPAREMPISQWLSAR